MELGGNQVGHRGILGLGGRAGKAVAEPTSGPDAGAGGCERAWGGVDGPRTGQTGEDFGVRSRVCHGELEACRVSSARHLPSWDLENGSKSQAGNQSGGWGQGPGTRQCGPDWAVASGTERKLLAVPLLPPPSLGSRGISSALESGGALWLSAAPAGRRRAWSRGDAWRCPRQLEEARSFCHTI